MKLLNEIILLTARLNPSLDVTGYLKNVMQDSPHPVDYDRLIMLASQNEIAPLVYNNLKGFNFIPDDVMSKLRSAYLYTARNNIRNAEEMVRIMNVLRKKGVDVIPLKGSIASDIIFGDPGLYPSVDIDILVRPSDISKAELILTEAGYGKNNSIDENDLLASHYHLLYRKGRHFLEVHWNLAKRYFDILPDFWWEDTEVTEYGGIGMQMLSTERYVLYLIFRLYDHGFRPLKFFVLTAEIINKYRKDIDWGKLIYFSEIYRMKRLVLFVLKLLADMLGSQIPGGIKNTKVFGYDFLKRVVMSGLFSEIQRPHLRMFVYASLQETPLDMVKILAGRVFPNASEIRLRHHLPAGSKKVYIYYLLNPLLLLTRKIHSRP